MNSVHRAAGVGFRIMMWVEARPGAAGFGFLGSFMGPVSEQQVAECFWGMIGKGRKEQRRQVWEWAQGFCLWTCRCPRQMAEGGAPRTLWSKAYSRAPQLERSPCCLQLGRGRRQVEHLRESAALLLSAGPRGHSLAPSERSPFWVGQFSNPNGCAKF